MPIEDILFAKNRHIFGGIEPSNMRLFSAVSAYNGQDRIKLTYELPNDTIVNGQMICSVGGAIIRRKTTGYPENEFDGEFVADVTENGSMYDTTVTWGTSYFYAAFPYSGNQVFNRSNTGRANNGDPLGCKANRGEYLFGYDLDLSDPNPETRVTYPIDVQNAGYSGIYMDSLSRAILGDWENAPFMPRTCVFKVDNSGILSYDTSNTNYTTTNNTMVEWPKIYVKRWKNGNVYHFRCSDMNPDGTWNCWSNYDRNGNVIDHFYTSVFPATEANANGGTLKSLAGSVIKKSGNSLSSMITKAKKNGNDWNIDCLADILLIQDLLTMMLKSTDSQKFGYGWSYKYNQSASLNYFRTEMDIPLFQGMPKPTNSSQTSRGVAVFGMWDLWGCIPRRVAGWLLVDGAHRIKITEGKSQNQTKCPDGTSAVGYNTTGEGYIYYGSSDGDSDTRSSLASAHCYAVGSGDTNIGYLKKTAVTKFGRIPYLTASGEDGSANTYECDEIACDVSGTYCATIGGYPPDRITEYAQAVRNGIFNVDFTTTPSDTTSEICTGLSFKPSLGSSFTRPND